MTAHIHYFFNAVGDVIYRFQYKDGPGIVTLSLCGSTDFDSLLRVGNFSGGNFSEIAFDDDGCSGENGRNELASVISRSFESGTMLTKMLRIVQLSSV